MELKLDVGKLEWVVCGGGGVEWMEKTRNDEIENVLFCLD